MPAHQVHTAFLQLQLSQAKIHYLNKINTPEAICENSLGCFFWIRMEKVPLRQKMQ